MYYKVVEELNSDVIIDTKNTNYSSTLSGMKNHNAFFQVTLHFSEIKSLPLDFFVLFNNNLAYFGNEYLSQIPPSKDGVFEISSLTGKPHHREKYIDENELIEIIEFTDRHGIQVFDKGFYLWEYIFEKIRQKEFNERQSRIDAFYLFENEADCNYYIKTHKGGGIICEVEIEEEKNTFRGDMNLMDETSFEWTIEKSYNQARKYWRGEISENPKMEILFSGLCKLKKK
jgi:hypothetical protein